MLMIYLEFKQVNNFCLHVDNTVSIGMETLCIHYTTLQIVFNYPVIEYIYFFLTNTISGILHYTFMHSVTYSISEALPLPPQAQFWKVPN